MVQRRGAQFLILWAGLMQAWPQPALAFETAQVTLVEVTSIESYLAATPAGEGASAGGHHVQHLLLTGYGRTLFNAGIDPALSRPGAAVTIDLPFGVNAQSGGGSEQRIFELHARACYEYARTVMEEPGSYRLRIAAGYAAEQIGTAEADGDAGQAGRLRIVFNREAADRIHCALERVQ